MSKKKPGDSWRVISYDVWGNAEDGWEVNQAFRTSFRAHFDDDADDETILAALVECGYIAAGFTTDDVEFEDSGGDSIYITAADDARPICELQKE